jgi:hypothetical protein
MLIVMSELPLLYPGKVERFKDAFIVFEAKVKVSCGLPAVVKPKPLAAAAPNVDSVGILFKLCLAC